MTQAPPQSPCSPNHHGTFEPSNSPHQNGVQSPPPEPLDNQENRTEQHDTRQAVAEDDQEFFKNIRGGLMIVAILAAGSTYQAGLNPPGGFWESDADSHAAGNPVLHDTFFNRYQAFFYCNAISFLSSMVIIIFLMNKNFYHDKKKIKVLEITMVLDLFSFMAAYAVGSCRRVTSSIYVFLLMGLVFIYVISFARHYSLLHGAARQMPCASRCMSISHCSPRCPV